VKWRPSFCGRDLIWVEISISTAFAEEGSLGMQCMRRKGNCNFTNAGQGKMIVMSLNFSTVTRLKASAEWRFMF
jgi:hypothetical protein